MKVIGHPPGVKEQGFRASLIVKHCWQKCRQRQRKPEVQKNFSLGTAFGLQAPAQVKLNLRYPWIDQQASLVMAQLQDPLFFQTVLQIVFFWKSLKSD